MAPSSVPTPDDFITSFPLPVYKITGKPTYETLALARKSPKANAVSVPSAKGGGQHGYLGIVLSDAAYANVNNTPFVVPVNPGVQPHIPAGSTGPVIAVIVRNHKEAQREWREYNNIHAALKKQLIEAIDPIYLRAIQDDHVGFGNKTLREMLEFLFTTYGTISAIELQENNTRMTEPWKPSTPFETLINQFQDATDFAEAANQPYTANQIVNTAYALVYNTGLYFDDCKLWNRKAAADKTWTTFKKHFGDAHRKLRMQQRTSQQAGYHGANSITTMAHAADAIANLATATAADRQAMAALTHTIKTMSKQMQEKDAKIAQLQNAIPTTTAPKPANTRPQRNNGNYCWTHGFVVGKDHNSATCNNPKEGHQKEATEQT